MDITIATLIYKSNAYLDFVMNSLLEHESKIHNVHYLIVANDAEEQVKEYAKEWGRKPRITTVIHSNENPNEYYIQRVYKAFNRCLKECTTDYIYFINSDIAFTDGFLDNVAKNIDMLTIPTTRLVECGRMPSLAGLISKNFGQTISSFAKADFEKYAESIKENIITRETGAFMPSLFKTDVLRAAGGWRENKIFPGGHQVPGDQITFAILKKYFNMTNAMCHDSIAYHLQSGEKAESGDLK